MSANAERKRILVVDDEADIRSFLDVLLTMEGYQVSAHADVDSALKALNNFTPHVVLLDYMLPDKSPRVIIDKLRSRVHTIILMTAHRDPAQVSRMLGLENFLAKPFDVDELLAQVRKLANKPGPVLKSSSVRLATPPAAAKPHGSTSAVG